MNDPILYCSGLDPETGDYAIPPCTPRELADLVRRTTVDKQDAQDLDRWVKAGGKGLYGDARDLTQAGWGVIFAQNEPPGRIAALREALKPLLDLRREQTGGEPLFREYSEGKGYLPGDTKRKFLNRHGIAPGPAQPNKMPYYLLIVGSPESIPYDFQYQLDVERAVGRLWFETLEEYERYARSVVAAEKSTVPRRRRAAFFSPRNPGDPVSDVCVDHLASPLASWVEEHRSDWETYRVLGDEATKGRLAQLLGGDETPDFLFTASHGTVFSASDDRVLPHQGALMCREWPGPSFRGRFPTDFYFAGEDLASTARLDGLIAFLWACYSAGGPATSDFELGRVPVAPRPFLGQLPYRLLSHPQGSALAVIGHIELVWIWSAQWPSVGTHLKEFEEMLRMLLEGYPVGAAMEPFGRRYAELATELYPELLDIQRGDKKPDDETIFRLCVCHDTRNYVVLGDPAVRLVPPVPAEPRT
jgi:hypothetical protein